jgi:FkbM family methyltransferase
MQNKHLVNVNKLFSRGALYSLKIEIYKILYDEKYSNSQFRRWVYKFVEIIAKNTNLSQPKFILKTLDKNVKSFAQIKQDLFVLTMLNYKKDGFFIEVGAGDGINFSNTYLLEKEFNWRGILIEPNKTFFESCLKSRKCKVINKILLDGDKTELKFYEKISGEFSHAEGFGNVSASEVKSYYSVEIINFDEIFDSKNVPEEIDFLSIDTEGSEAEILSSIDFSKYSPKVICIEHNFNKKNRVFFKKHLANKGYKLTYTGVSRWDSWFVRNPI